MNKNCFDYLIVGSGLAGSVLAERLASAGNQILIIDRRNHIAGNVYDYYNSDGILIHKYGPHIFHTNSKEVFEYLGRFTEWRPYEHCTLASVDGQLVPIPINQNTINALFGVEITGQQAQDFFDAMPKKNAQVITAEDHVINTVGQNLYEKLYKSYTLKQWGIEASELDASVTARVPARANRDNRYFTDTYQAMPKDGYTNMVSKMLHHSNIKIMLQTDFEEAKHFSYKKVIYTGPIDKYFNHCFGELPYRSLKFKFETFSQEKYQPTGIVNYPNNHLYTRITEFKYLTGQVHPKTTIAFEYPSAEGDPFYPIPRPENNKLYIKYKKLADKEPNAYFTGRLATYKYYNMDQVVAQSLSLFNKITEAKK